MSIPISTKMRSRMHSKTLTWAGMTRLQYLQGGEKEAYEDLKDYE